MRGERLSQTICQSLLGHKWSCETSQKSCFLPSPFPSPSCKLRNTQTQFPKLFLSPCESESQRKVARQSTCARLMLSNSRNRWLPPAAKLWMWNSKQIDRMKLSALVLGLCSFECYQKHHKHTSPYLKYIQCKNCAVHSHFSSHTCTVPEQAAAWNIKPQKQ